MYKMKKMVVSLLVRLGLMVDSVIQFHKDQKERFKDVEAHYKKISRIDPPLGKNANINQWCALAKLNDEEKEHVYSWLRGESWEFTSGYYDKKFTKEVKEEYKKRQENRDSGPKFKFLFSGEGLKPDDYRHLVMFTFNKTMK